jgi:hypothetical protein
MRRDSPAAELAQRLVEDRQRRIEFAEWDRQRQIQRDDPGAAELEADALGEEAIEQTVAEPVGSWPPISTPK